MSPSGGTPETLESQQEQVDHYGISSVPSIELEQNVDDGNISQEIEELMHFVDKFQFRSPLASCKAKTNFIAKNIASMNNPSHSTHNGQGATRRSPDPPATTPPRPIHQRTGQNTQKSALAQLPVTVPVEHRVPMTERTNTRSFLMQEMDDSISNLSFLVHGYDENNEENDRIGLAASTCLKQSRTSTTSPTGDPEGRLVSGGHFIPNNTSSLKKTNTTSAQEATTPQEEITDCEWEQFNGLVSKVESALKEAKQEKEMASLWAKQVREATEAWVHQQKQLLVQEQHRLDDEKRRDEKSVNQSNNSSLSLQEARIERLEQCLRGLELDLKTTELHHQTNEKRLLGIIHYQQERLRKLEAARQNTLEATAAAAKAVVKESAGKAAPTPTRLNHSTKCKKASPCSVNEELLLAQELNQKTTDLPQEIQFSGEDKEVDTICSLQDPSHYHKPFVGATPATASTVHRPSSNPPPTSHLSRSMGVHAVLPSGEEHIARADGSTSIRHTNGDVQIMSPNNPARISAIYHVSSKIVQVLNRDGSQTFEYPDRQVERHYPDGRKVVKWPDGSIERFLPDGTVDKSC